MVAVLLLSPLLIAMELGFRLGARQRKRRPPLNDEPRGDVVLTSMLALLGLMLAFTYSFTMGRADLRKQALIAEVNALGTAFLRADLLAEPGRTKVRQRIHEYAKSRCVEPGTRLTLEHVQHLVERSEEIGSRIWPEVTSAFRQSECPTAPEKALIISATNDILDAQTRRTAVFWDRLPTAVLLLLLLIASISIGVAAHHSSLGGHQPRWRMSALALILGSLMYVILDFDMIVRGLIQVDHASLIDLVRDMRSELDP
jgi:hypothetical protein